MGFPARRPNQRYLGANVPQDIAGMNDNVRKEEHL